MGRATAADVRVKATGGQELGLASSIKLELRLPATHTDDELGGGDVWPSSVLCWPSQPCALVCLRNAQTEELRLNFQYSVSLMANT